jgi:hypothetical protein
MECIMSPSPLPQVRLSIVAAFPKNYFLENLAIRADNSVLVTALNHKELWYVPSSPNGIEVAPQLLFTFPHLAMGIVEVMPDVFYITTSEIYTWSASHLYRLDLNGWTPGKPVHPEPILHFPEQVRGLNGSCVVAPGLILFADCFAGLIWRVDLNMHDGKPKASIWLRHDSMGYFPGQMKPEQPGVNGVQYSPKRGYLYYTNTAKQLLMRVKVEPATYDPVGEPEVVGGGRMFDDFWIDQDAGFAYLTTHRQNTIDRLSLEPAQNSEKRISIAGDPFTPELIGPSAGHWGRRPGEYGRLAFFTTEGGIESPPEGGPQPAKLVKVELLTEAAVR